MRRLFAYRVKPKIIVGLLLIFGPATAADWDLASFAECIKASGAKYYGAHWCPQCRKQTAMFGRGAEQLPYIECAVEGEREKLRRCAHIEAYPTWVFAGGQIRTGVLSVARLASYTGCELVEQSHFRYLVE
jgi:hypothetical protein